MNEQIKHLLALPDAPRYNIKAVVQQTQVNISTLRAWEQRYGVPRPKRSEHGHRLYSQRDVAIIKWLRQCTEEGLAISQAVVMLRELDAPGVPAVAAPIAAPAPLSGLPHFSNRAWPDIREQLMDALAAVNMRHAHLLVNHACAMFPIETVILELFQPTLIEAGERWSRGQWCAAEEHVVSNFIRQRLLGLIQLHAPFAQGPRLICGCAPGEQHELGLLMFALLMEQRNWEVVYLGQSLPPEGLADFLVRLAPGLVCLSASLVEHVPGLLELCQLVKSLEHYQLVPIYSGRVFDLYPELLQRMPGYYIGNDLHEAINRAIDFGDTIAPERAVGAPVLQQRTRSESIAFE
jgi:DNA-binding transcriptional MerR regulator